MFAINGTAKLLKALRVAATDPSPPTTRLGNWYANFVAGPRGPIVCISARTYLPVMLPGSVRSALPRTLADELAKLLEAIEVPAPLIEQERFAMAQSTWAKTDSRSVLGVLNEQAFMASVLLNERFESWAALNRQLAENIVKLRFPIDLTREAFGLERLRRPPSLTALPRLPPLALRAHGDWDPADEYWGEEGDPLPTWAKKIIKRGRRPAFEMEQVIPGLDPDDWDSDPILESNDLKAAGHHREAIALLNGLLARDPRCLDAHAHLGNAVFDRDPNQALHHYRAGVAIGDEALRPGFSGVLPWGLIDNRPYLRCLHGVGLSLWRLGQTKEAAAVFSRMLWLNPSDNQGARFNLEHVERGRAWTPEDE